MAKEGSGEYSKERIQAEMEEAKEKARGWSISAGWLFVISGLILFLAVAYFYSYGFRYVDLPIVICVGLGFIPGILCLRKARGYEGRYEEWKSRL